MSSDSGIILTPATTIKQVAEAEAATTREKREAAPDFTVDDLTIQGPRVLAKFLDAPDVSRGGIHLPAGARDAKAQTTCAQVLKIGDGRNTEHGVHVPVKAVVGQTVIVGAFSGTRIGLGDSIRIISDTEIIAVVSTASEE